MKNRLMNKQNKPVQKASNSLKEFKKNAGGNGETTPLQSDPKKTNRAAIITEVDENDSVIGGSNQIGAEAENKIF